VGQELECTMRYQRRRVAGKAHLESDYVLFRGGADRLKVTFKELTGVTAAAGVLRLEFAGGPAELELGNAAGKWAGKILHPPTRADKLGLKPGMTARVDGDFEAAFLEEIASRQVVIAGPRQKADIVFYLAGRTADLGKVPKLAGGLKPDGALWIVFPKGAPVIREMEVLQAGRDAGLKDNKVASFSVTHTALKFVIPLANRR
jgi:hypothetical protein